MQEAIHILVLSQDPVFAADLAGHLSQDQDMVAVADQTKADRIDLIILDQEGWTGEISGAVPILRVSADGPDREWLVKKPFKIATLRARVRALIHAARRAAGLSISAAVTFYPAQGVIEVAGHKVRLTSKETALLRCLYDKRGETISRQDLLEQIWGYDPSIATHTLETHIYRLRHKTEAYLGGEALILTEQGGYRLAKDGYDDAQ